MAAKGNQNLKKGGERERERENEDARARAKMRAGEREGDRGILRCEVQYFKTEPKS